MKNFVRFARDSDQMILQNICRYSFRFNNSANLTTRRRLLLTVDCLLISTRHLLFPLSSV